MEKSSVPSIMTRLGLWKILMETPRNVRSSVKFAPPKGGSEEMEIDETDNEDIGANADVEDEEMAPLQEEQLEQVERSGTENVEGNLIPDPVASASASTSTPPTNTGQQRRGRVKPPTQHTQTRFTLRTPLPCGLSRTMVREPHDLPNVQIRY